jgi:hypothetical protein
VRFNQQLLTKITAVAALVVGVFLVIGGYGHLQGTWGGLTDNNELSGLETFTMLASGGVLLIPGLINIVSCIWIWRAKPKALLFSILVTLIAFAYLFYLLVNGVPNHPIGFFALLLAAYLLLLLYTRSDLKKLELG